MFSYSANLKLYSALIEWLLNVNFFSAFSDHICTLTLNLVNVVLKSDGIFHEANSNCVIRNLSTLI